MNEKENIRKITTSHIHLLSQFSCASNKKKLVWVQWVRVVWKYSLSFSWMDVTMPNYSLVTSLPTQPMAMIFMRRRKLFVRVCGNRYFVRTIKPKQNHLSSRSLLYSQFYDPNLSCLLCLCFFKHMHNDALHKTIWKSESGRKALRNSSKFFIKFLNVQCIH